MQSPSDDHDLVRRARRGDESAFHEMVERHAGSLYRLAVSLVGNAADAEDALQEALAGAFRGLPKFEERSSLKTWLTRILVKQAARQHRARGRFPTFPAEEALERPTSEAGDAAATRMDVLAAMEALPADHREVIALREIQGMTYDEIAEMLSVPRGTVESRLFRARRALRERLKDYLP